MKMTFNDLKQEVYNYIARPHHHSEWNAKYLHFVTRKDSSPDHNMHYYVIYVEPGRKFKISMCRNNIKFQGTPNIPGSFHDNKGRILGACLDFSRHHGIWINQSHDYKKDCQANKWEQYDNEMFDKNSGLTADSSSNFQVNSKIASPLNKNTMSEFKKNAKSVIKTVNSSTFSNAFKQLVANMGKCNFTLISYSASSVCPNSAEFLSSRKTVLSINIHKGRATFNNPDGLNLVKLAKPKLYIRDYYAAVKGAQKDKKNYSFKI